MSIMSWKNTTGKETDKNNYRGRMHVAVVKSWLWHPEGCRFESWFHECVSNKSQFLSFIAAQVAFLVNLLRESEGCTRAKNIVHQVPDAWTKNHTVLSDQRQDPGTSSRQRTQTEVGAVEKLKKTWCDFFFIKACEWLDISQINDQTFPSRFHKIFPYNPTECNFNGSLSKNPPIYWHNSGKNICGLSRTSFFLLFLHSWHQTVTLVCVFFFSFCLQNKLALSFLDILVTSLEFYCCFIVAVAADSAERDTKGSGNLVTKRMHL